ncbi:MAG TPA: hypothetical protein VFQ42_03940 [Mycobacterium sp.]|nr:hypothetical protein [Mycobacterium sp.]
MTATVSADRSGATPITSPDPDRSAVPPEWMPGIWDAPDADGFPARHQPATPHQDIWIAKCGEFCFESHPVATVIANCLPCLACELADEADKRSRGGLG